MKPMLPYMIYTQTDVFRYMNLGQSTPAEHLLLSLRWSCFWVCMRTYLQIWAQASWHVKWDGTSLIPFRFLSRTQKPHCYLLDYKSDWLLLLGTGLWLKVWPPALKHTQQQQVLMLRHTWSCFEKAKREERNYLCLQFRFKLLKLVPTLYTEILFGFLYWFSIFVIGFTSVLPRLVLLYVLQD